MPMLQLTCNTFVQADSLDANTSVTIGFVLYAYLKDPIMVRQQTWATSQLKHQAKPLGCTVVQ